MSEADGPRVLQELGGGLFAVHKPAGWRVHPANDDGTPDLVAWLATQGRSMARPAHRIDAAASGIVLCGQTPAARARAGAWFTENQVHKVYLALVLGCTRKKGTIRRALADGRRGRKLDAVTHYRCVEQLGQVSLLAVQIETGRKHQIRRHLQGLGHSIVGDDRYRPKRFVSVPGFPGRLWLHARVLQLPGADPIEDPLPTELLDHLEVLRACLQTGEE